MKKIFDIIFSTSFAGLYMLIFAFAIGAATFIENDYGTDTAQQVIFTAKWFELLLLLFAITLVVNIFKYKLYRKEKWSVFLFHTSIIIILAGSLITRYASYEGVMGIREGAANNQILLNEAYLQTSVFDGEKGLLFENKVLFGSWFKNNFKKTYRTPKGDINVELVDFIPNAVEEVQDDPEGKLTLELVIAGQDGQRKDIFFQEGEVRLMGGYWLSFKDVDQENSIQFKYQNDSLFFKTSEEVASMTMATMAKDTLVPNEYHSFQVRTLYSFRGINLVMKNYHESASLNLVSNSIKVNSSNEDALKIKLTCGDEEKTITILGTKGAMGKKKEFDFCGQRFFMSYGSKFMDLPFSLKLNDFQLERYPGSNSPASYASEVTLLDGERGINRDQRIYMNHVLDHRGYRFFQSSYDPDEKGTILSVNHDYWGTLVTYIGYTLLALGMFFTLFLRKSRFVNLSKKVSKLKTKASVFIGFAIAFQVISFSAKAQENTNKLPVFSIDSLPVIDLAHADSFSRVLVQDYQGRMKPMHTLASELVRKVSSKVKIYGQNPSQTLISMTVYPEYWQHAPLIKITHPDLAELIHIAKERKTLNDYLDKDKEVRATYWDFFDKEGRYLLTEKVEEASRLKGADQTIFHKELIKVDEKLNILQAIFTTRLLRIFPREDKTDTYWDTPLDIVQKQQQGEKTNIFTDKFFGAYMTYVRQGVDNNNWTDANQFLSLLNAYQHKLGSDIIPSQGKINAEIAYNKSGVFGWLILVYMLTGFLLFMLLIARLFKPYRFLSIPIALCFGILTLAFLAHTAGLGARWYILDRAPWSNAYESLVYIAWASMLAGFIFVRRSSISLAATAILGAAVLAVAGLNMMNPELSPLVPVLKSYWLSIHVSMIVASYGFLALGSLMGLINLLLMIFNYKGNNKNILRTIKELTYINEMTLTVGLFMISIGTFLGGVWANESWGRYWGWDSKETWALVVILIYAFVLHLRLIPGYRGRYAFNLASLVAYFSVIMTYFGVNYYLSGLHSYAAGDPVPVPDFVYYAVGGVFVVALAAFVAQRKVKE